MKPDEQKALNDINEYGCHIIHVLEENDLPPFSYTVGIYKMNSKPEACVVGLKQPVAEYILNEYNSRLRNGQIFESGKLYSGFLEGFRVYLVEVDKKHFKEYFGWDLWLYNGSNFDMLQFVYPDTGGVRPNEPAASDWFRKWQTILTSTGHSTVPKDGRL